LELSLAKKIVKNAGPEISPTEIEQKLAMFPYHGPPEKTLIVYHHATTIQKPIKTCPCKDLGEPKRTTVDRKTNKRNRAQCVERATCWGPSTLSIFSRTKAALTTRASGEKIAGRDFRRRKNYAHGVGKERWSPRGGGGLVKSNSPVPVPLINGFPANKSKKPKNAEKKW